MESASDSPTFIMRPPQLRSRVTNGRTVFAIGGDGRGAWTRRWKDLCEAHTNDCGGASRLTEAKLSLCRRAATLEVQFEQLEAQMSEGKDVDLACLRDGRRPPAAHPRECRAGPRNEACPDCPRHSR